ncbi:MAG TPA: Tex-like N-terminal domain-containing protein, partial [Planctomycetota bacterium]|nr:Tex-like N-terminal domain-containing protein [Planctomycetota bacterium]
MTSTQIVEQLAREFSASPDEVRGTLEMLDAGLRAPFIGRVRRAETGGLSEGFLRRMHRRRSELDDLDRRRGTILRLLEEAGVSDGPALERVRACMDRFELEDLFLPHRRPEPEVQLALDRGLGRLADLLVAPVPPEERQPQGTESAPSEADAARGLDREAAADDEASEAAHEDDPQAHGAHAEELHPEEPHAEELTTEEQQAGEEQAETQEDGRAEAESAAEGGEDTALANESGDEPAESRAAQEAAAAAEDALLHGQIELTPALARLCAPFVSPDRGVHTESEALTGAMRILSDRLGRDTHLRGSVRQLLRKHGVLSVRSTVDESKLGRHRALLKVRQPLRQVQGHRLLAIRQAQKERALTTVITLDRRRALPRVRAALGRHTHPDHGGVLDAIALRTLEHRLLPLLEADVRLELKERADEEALRFLSQHLRQVLLAPPFGHRPVAGVDVSAKADWTIAVLDPSGAPAAAPLKIETAGKDSAALGAELAALLHGEGVPRVEVLAVGNGKAGRAALQPLRAALAEAHVGVPLLVVNEAGLSSYASSELARSELAELSVPQRMAVSTGRRLQDTLDEILKVDPRHLGLGSEQGLVSKANLRRMFDEVIESCTAHVGCDVNRAPLSFLQHVPGLDLASARKLLERRAERPFESREELRGVLSEAQWTNAIAFLRVPASREPLDATALHPEQYDLARRVVESAGGTVEDGLGKPWTTKGLRREDFAADEITWRDLMREIARPGRDPRLRLFPPRLLDPGTDRATLAKDRVVEGVITSVAGFGAFVDLGTPQDGMIHVSEISARYVRDARELVAIGEVVRARILDAGGQRIALSLKG